jgi:hypothetical protein
MKSGLLSDRPESIERLFARSLEIDHWLRTVRTKPDSGLGKHTFGGIPRAVHKLVGESRDLRDEASHVSAVRVEFPSLRYRMEDTKVGSCIGAAASNPLPAGAVVGKVGIDQCVPEPGFTMMPVQQQVLD